MSKKAFYFALKLISVLVIHVAYASEDRSNKLNYTLTAYEQHLIQHVQKSIENAEQGVSLLSEEVLSLEGMSSAKVRHLLNNLCSLPERNYLEIGTWQGSTWIAALYNNSLAISSAIAIDNWSQFNGPKNQFTINCNLFLKNREYKFIEDHCFQVDLNSFSNPVNLYFYDGDHSMLSQKQAFTYFDRIFDNTFIAVVDDWNFVEVPAGTYAAFAELNYTILFETILPARWNCDHDNWWNGIYIAIIRKP